jgi:hypothetical protein
MWRPIPVATCHPESPSCLLALAWSVLVLSSRSVARLLLHTLHRTALHPPAARYPVLPISAPGAQHLQPDTNGYSSPQVDAYNTPPGLPLIGAIAAEDLQLQLSRKVLTIP